MNSINVVCNVCIFAFKYAVHVRIRRPCEDFFFIEVNNLNRMLRIFEVNIILMVNMANIFQFPRNNHRMEYFHNP